MLLAFKNISLARTGISRLSSKPTMNRRFTKSFTQQESITRKGIDRTIDDMHWCRLNRYNTGPGEISETELLKEVYAQYRGVDYCLACPSRGYALHIALRSASLQASEPIITIAFTLAPVPGAINNAGGKVILTRGRRNLLRRSRSSRTTDEKQLQPAFSDIA